MQIGKYYKSKLSGLTLRYKGFLVGVNLLDDDAQLYAEEVFKVMDERAAYKTERILEAHVSFKERSELVIRFTTTLQELVQTFKRTELEVVEDHVGQYGLPFPSENVTKGGDTH